MAKVGFRKYQSSNLVQKLIESTNVQPSTKAPLLPNPCCTLFCFEKPMWITLLEISATITKISIIFVKQKESKMKNLSIKEIKSIQQTAIFQYKENMKKEGRSKTAHFFADSLMRNYDNVIIEDDMVIGYYRNGVNNIPSMPKY